MARVKRSIKGSSIYVDVREVNWVVLLVMSIIFGFLGVDRYIMGKVGTGLLKMFTLGGLGIWWLVDIVLIATKYKYKDVKYID